MNFFRDAKVLVTGGAGSIGSELCKRLAVYGAHVTALCHSEISLYNLNRRLGCRVEYALGDVLDERLMHGLVRRHDIVIHAAAMKHVPLCEEWPLLAIATNVFGTDNVTRVCRNHSKPFLLVSTDKAVHPASVMGATKRVAELIVRDHMEPTSLVVRFGNVLDSSGSVLPLWREQIQKGRPLTLTHPDCERYFMAIPDAVELVLQAAAYHIHPSQMQSGLYMLDMGKPRRMQDVAAELMAEMGRRVPVVVIGLRPGEKLTEELNYGGEVFETGVPKLKRIFEPSPRALAYDEVRGMEYFVRKGDAVTALDRLWRLVK